MSSQTLLPSLSHPSAAPSLDGLRIVVTGGTAGLGQALVRNLARRGARIAQIARRQAAANDPSVLGITGDVSQKEDIYPIAMQALAFLGGVDVLINNASDLGTVPLAPLADTDCEDLERAFATNALGPFRLTKALLGALAASAREGRQPVVINISSDAALNPYPRWGAYSVTKAALHHMSRIWDLELSGAGVRVLTIDPGDMDTAMHALAVPDADRTSLKPPEDAAQEIVQQLAAVLKSRQADSLQEVLS